MKPWMKKSLLLSISAGLMVPTLAACTKTKGADSNTERVLRVATSFGFGDDEYFRQQFTEIFEFANPNIKIEIIPTMDDSYRYGGRMDPNKKPVDPMEKLKEVMQGDNPPDVVMVGYEQLNDLISNNLLTQLDPMITKDKFDITDMVPAVIDGLKKTGDGKLYALAPTFSSSALIYNKRMFDEAGVPYPKDKMTWDEVFDLGKRLIKGEGENRKAGFSFSTQSMGDLFYSMQMYTAPLQLRMFDEKGEKMTVDSDQWEKVWKSMLKLKQDKVLPEQQDPSKMKGQMMSGENFNPFQYDDFLSNRVAMSIINYSQLNQITNANKNAANFPGYTPIDWDVVTVPVHPEAPDVGGYIGMNGIMGINAKAQNVEDAWKFIKFINSEDWARLKSNSSYNLVARKKFIKPKDGIQFHIEAFTTLTPAPTQDYKIYQEKPNIYQVQDLGRQLFNDVVEGKLQVRDALKKWQTDGDAMLQQIKENPNVPINNPATMRVG